MTRRPVAPDDPSLRDYTEPQITALLGELRKRGRPYGLLWGSVSATDTTIDGRILVDFGNAPVSTLLNLLHLLRDAERNEAWDR
ncbi:hypothetical protein F7Q99_12660 [Streptomyces kaniharaensis]|uniref:Uncharacterized protein n=1 Tax=Streptomyces kaniharaensis TaxID=212423 RepID=A0A6N7KNX1_9ACTN|nr:hypothetical protein [Streptomyces kaniharaensis]MQS13111.1 hypothetical protein [Streptomyces kaniharaensis]